MTAPRRTDLARGALIAALIALVAACSRELVVSSATDDGAAEARPGRRDHTRDRNRDHARRPRPTDELKAIPAADLCVTRGALTKADGMLEVREPTMRAVAARGDGDRAALRFVYLGATEERARLASGQERHQLGLKLRAADGCNLVYVMWRLSPKPGIEVSVKRNPDAHSHAACGASGYTKLKGDEVAAVTPPEPGETHTLRAEISGDRLVAWVDDRQVWAGALPDSVRDLRGPAGVRSDNVAAYVELQAAGGGDPHCPSGADEPD